MGIPIEEFRRKAERTFIVRLNAPSKQWGVNTATGEPVRTEITVEAPCVEDAMVAAVVSPDWLPAQRVGDNDGTTTVSGRVLDCRGRWHKAGVRVRWVRGVPSYEAWRR